MNDNDELNRNFRAPQPGSPPAGDPLSEAASSDAPQVEASAPGAGGNAGPLAADSSAGERTSAPTQQELAVRLALESVLDPEIGLSVIDLGLIREINIFPDRTHVRMMLTTPFCPYAPQMMADVKQATEAVVPVPCDVEIMPDAWSPQLMPDPGLLGYSF